MHLLFYIQFFGAWRFYF